MQTRPGCVRAHISVLGPAAGPSSSGSVHPATPGPEEHCLRSARSAMSPRREEIQAGWPIGITTRAI